MSHTNPLPERLRASADEVQSFPHPTFCDHLHVAHDVMREAAAALEAYELGARSTAAQPVEPTGLRSAALAMVAKMDVLKPHMDALCLDSHNRGRPYKGPTYGIELEALRAAASGDSTPPSEPACETCKGVGMIGGFVNADSGYDGMPCPECSPKGDPSGALQPEPEAVGQGRWRPIETAPKDGAEFLAVWGRQGNVVQVVQWNRLHRCWQVKGEPAVGFQRNATAWQPLPEPPQASGERGD